MIVFVQACGFEMLSKHTALLPRLDSGSAPAYDPSTNPEYQRLLKSLQEKGFFDGVGIEGSREWTERERNAREAWTRNRGNSWVHISRSFERFET